MTDRAFGVRPEVRAAVEDTELPLRLREQVFETIENREDRVTPEEADEIARAVEHRYMETRVDPLDPVGTVSAQSIGEPGTQMSIAPDEKILVRKGGETAVTEIGPTVDELLDRRESRTFDGHEVALAPDDLEVLSLSHDETVSWKPVEEVSRHDAPEELLRIELDSGRSIRATKAHSFVTEVDGEVVPVRGDSLSVGDALPVAGTYDPAAGAADFSSLLSESVSKTSRESGVVAPDGGSVVAATDDGAVGTAEWDRIDSIETVEPDGEYVYDVSVAGLETFTTASGVVTHNTMNTFHYAGVAEIDVTQGLPRLIELVDARKTPDTPTMTVHLEGEYATERERAHEVVWEIEATKILALGDVSTNVADMQVRIDLNEGTLRDRWPEKRDADGTVIETPEEQLERAVGDIRETIERKLKNVGNSGLGSLRTDGTVITFEPGQPSYRDLLQLVEALRDVVFKGIEDVSRVVIRKEDAPEHPDRDEEFVLYTEGSALKDVLGIEGVDASRTTSNNIHEVHENLGVEAARNAIINETMETLEEQGLDDVNIRHLMLVADIMTNRGTIESIGRHGISGSKESVLARAAFEVTVNHLLDAAVHGEVDALNGVTENVIVGKPIKLGTGDVDLRMGSRTGVETDGGRPEDADAD